MNKSREILRGDILIQENRIEEISPYISPMEAYIIDAKDKVIIPGMIQTHIHLTQTLFRGQSDDLELMDWLKNRIWPLEGAHDEESNYYAALLGLAELIMGGTTAIIDMGTVNHTEEILEAIYLSGVRAKAGKCMMDYGKGVPQSLMENTEKSISESIKLLKKWNLRDGGRIEYAFAPRFVVSCSEELLVRVRDLAREHKVSIHTHASENRGEIALVRRDRGMENIKYLHSLGLTGEDLILAHCIWLDEEEMSILAQTGTKISHCPNSNLKLASGIAKIPELLKLGANVSIGADGAPCNNNLDIFKELRTAALIQKARLLDPTTMPALTVFEMATLGGARALNKQNSIGSLEVGKKADIVILDLNNIHNTPSVDVDVMAQLVYSAKAEDVITTIVNGKILMENKKLKTLNIKDIRENCNRIIKKQIDRAGVVKGGR